MDRGKVTRPRSHGSMVAELEPLIPKSGLFQEAAMPPPDAWLDQDGLEGLGRVRSP